jgi:hypothetical protein
MNSRRMRWAGHVTRMGNMRNSYKIVVGKLKGIYHAEDISVDVRIILKCILEK